MTQAPLPISVLIQTKNEELAIGECLDALTDFREVIVIDSLSTDRTVEIARARGAAVVAFDWNGRYPKKKQWQLENVPVASPWILMLDADERPSAELVAALRAATAHPDDSIGAFALRLEYHFAGKALKHGHRVEKTALLRVGRAHFEPVDDLSFPGIGELEGHYQPVIDGRIARVEGLLVHDDPDSVSTWFERHNRYSDWEAHLRVMSQRREDAHVNRSRQGRLFAKAPFKPFLFFTYSYLVRGGFLDGRAGLDYAIALSMYYWQIGVKVRELNRANSGR